MNISASNKTRIFICLALALVTFGIYWQVHGFGFLNYDDPDYVSENPMVNRGLTFKGIAWAFTHFYAANWHPLTWISHMLDCQIFGLNPGGPHVINVLFHAANAILLLLLLQRLTGALWRSAIVAAVFALHPLHVESVAWISERKDVLSTFFGLLSLLAYVRYVHELKANNPRAKIRFGWALALFALSLLAKPMLVTLPCVMLLLDFWPLQRVENSGWRTFFTRQFAGLVKEKWPWFALVAILCALTILAQSQGQATVAAGSFPLQWRLFNAIDSYFWYIEKTFWPAKLAVFYPLVTAIPVKTFAVASSVILIVTVTAVLTIRRCPFLFVGWFWFVGALVPVIGLVQVGSQATADRYSYISMVGVLIAVVWGAHWLLSGSRIRILAGGLAAAIVLVSLAVAAFSQIHYWKNSITLFRHDLDVTDANVTALNNLGVAFDDEGRESDAEKMYRVALGIRPDAPGIHKNLGLVLAKKGDTAGALSEYREEVRVNPHDAGLRDFLAQTLVRLGRNEEALPHFTEAVRLKPDNAKYQNSLAVCLAALGRRTEAKDHYQQAALLEPGNAGYQNNFATALFRAGELDAAMEHYHAAIAADPADAEAYSNLGALYFRRAMYNDAANQYTQAVRLNPTNAGIRFNAARTLLKVQNVEGAMAHLAEAARLRPDWAEPRILEAWTLATSVNDKLRNGPEAVKLAENAAELTDHKDANVLLTLSAAYAENGRFDEAMATANQALEIAKQLNQPALAAKIERARTLFQAHTPLRENTAAN